MIKIPTLFQRDEKFKVVPQLTEGCEWAMRPGGLMTIKIDGMNVKIQASKLYRRLKPASGEYTMASYVPCDRDDTMDQYLWEAFDALPVQDRRDGIYEAYGPKINGNPQHAEKHLMVAVAPVASSLIVSPHQTSIERSSKLSVEEFFEMVKKELTESPEIEGLVFQFENPSMVLAKAAKIRRKDFGLPWPTVGTQVEVAV